jgi:predicted nucleotidyltransferase
MNADFEMTPELAEELLDDLKQRLSARGVTARIHVIGGTAMVLRLGKDFPRTTTDIDAVIAPLAPVAEVVKEIAEERGLPSDWLNANGAAWAPTAPRVGVEGVAISIASLEDLVAMKLAAGRHQDLVDLGALADELGIGEPEQLVDIAFGRYGEHSIALNESREDYLLLARDALRGRKRRGHDG